jgi:hypothetical protein
MWKQRRLLLPLVAAALLLGPAAFALVTATAIAARVLLKSRTIQTVTLLHATAGTGYQDPHDLGPAYRPVNADHKSLQRRQANGISGELCILPHLWAKHSPQRRSVPEEVQHRLSLEDGDEDRRASAVLQGHRPGRAIPRSERHRTK